MVAPVGLSQRIGTEMPAQYWIDKDHSLSRERCGNRGLKFSSARIRHMCDTIRRVKQASVNYL